METSKRHQIPTTNACPNFSFRGLRKKNFVTLFRDYFGHAYKLHTSQQWQHSTRAHGRFYYGRSRPGLRPDPGCARNYTRGWPAFNCMKGIKKYCYSLRTKSHNDAQFRLLCLYLLMQKMLTVCFALFWYFRLKSLEIVA